MTPCILCRLLKTFWFWFRIEYMTFVKRNLTSWLTASLLDTAVKNIGAWAQARATPEKEDSQCVAERPIVEYQSLVLTSFLRLSILFQIYVNYVYKSSLYNTLSNTYLIKVVNFWQGCFPYPLLPLFASKASDCWSIFWRPFEWLLRTDQISSHAFLPEEITETRKMWYYTIWCIALKTLLTSYVVFFTP